VHHLCRCGEWKNLPSENFIRSHYLPPVSLTPVANLPSVLLIPVAIFHIVDSGGKFAIGINNARGTGGKIYRRCL
jgi:hypothetical protein